MEAAIEVASPSAVVVARLMGSQECSGSVLVGEARWHSEGACRSAARKEKNQITRQSNSSSSRRGEKRGRVKHKSRCDPFSLKNGVVGYTSTAGGNNFLGMYGLKSDVCDITKFVNELSLHDLVSGNYTSPCISIDNGKSSASPSNNLMQSVRKACSVLQHRKGLQAQNSAKIDNGCIRSDSTSLIAVDSGVGQADIDKEDNCTSLLPSSNEVQESDKKIGKFSVADSPLYTPKHIFKRLALPLPKDLDLLLSDATKTSRISTDLCAGKPACRRTGLPPFPWSHSSSGHTKLVSDAVKPSANRATCQGRWVKVKNSIALQKGSSESLVDFDLLEFDQNLVPSENPPLEKQVHRFTSTEHALSTSGACSTSKVATDECTSSHAAAQTLLDMAAFSKVNTGAVVKLLKKPSQMTMKANKSKAIKRCDLLDIPSSIRASNALKVSYGVSSKKLRLSKPCMGHTELLRQGKLQESAVLPVKSPPRKLFRDSNASTDNYGLNLVKNTCELKAPRDIDRLGITKLKLWKPY